MKTHYYDIDLMVPQQTNKEVLLNEALLKLDNFCNNAVIDFIDSIPASSPKSGEKYILSDEQALHQICYCLDSSNGWQVLQPKTGMIVFVIRKNSFFVFDTKWHKINVA